MKKLFSVLGFLCLLGLPFLFPCFADLKIQAPALASGIVRWNEVSGVGRYILEESRVGPEGPWTVVYRGANNFCQVSRITKLWYRVRWEKAASANQTVHILNWSAVAQYTPPVLFIKKNPLRNGFVEWSPIPQANLYEVQSSPKEAGEWSLVYSGPYQNYGLRTSPGTWYRVRALQKKEGQLICATNWSKPQAFFRSAEGFLKTDGTVIKDQGGHGKEILLHGVNFGSLFLIEPWILGISETDTPRIEDDWSVRDILSSRFGASESQKLLDEFYNTYIQASDIDALYNLGVNMIRLPISYRLLQNEDGSWIRNPSGQIDFGRIDRVIKDCADRGLYVLLDLHGAPGSQSKERHSGRMDFNKLFDSSSEGEDYRRRTVELWQSIALHYQNNTALCGYDLLNEPSEPADEPSKNALWKLYDRIYKTIRSVDKNHIIMMEGASDWATLPRPAVMGWENVVYQFHYYHVSHNEDLRAHKAFIDQKVREGRMGQLEYQVPVMIGEFTCLGYEPTWAYYLENFNREKWGWALWTFKSRYSSPGWGLFNHQRPAADLPRLRTDSFQSLLSKLPSYATLGYYSLNGTLAKLIKDYSVPPTNNPFVKSISPESVPPGGNFWIKGVNFGKSQGTSQVMLEGLPLSAISWSDTTLHVSVPKNESRCFGLVSIRIGEIDSNETVLHVIQPQG